MPQLTRSKTQSPKKKMAFPKLRRKRTKTKTPPKNEIWQIIRFIFLGVISIVFDSTWNKLKYLIRHRTFDLLLVLAAFYSATFAIYLHFKPLPRAYIEATLAIKQQELNLKWTTLFSELQQAERSVNMLRTQVDTLYDQTVKDKRKHQCSFNFFSKWTNSTICQSFTDVTDHMGGPANVINLILTLHYKTRYSLSLAFTLKNERN